MAAVDEINGDIYQQMIDLQEKLRQSEAERSRMEEMFKVLLKTFKEEEDMRQKYLEARYRSFLDDCTRRNYRNEKILRSVERVENAANVLYAKTERLKLLRNHYEAYLGRVIPSWRQNFTLPYAPHQLSSKQKLEWPRQSQLIPAEIPEQQHGSYLTVSSTAKSRTSYPDQTVPAGYYPRKPIERERLNSQIVNYTNYFNRDSKSHTSKDLETWEKVTYTCERDRNSPENFDAQISDYSRNKPMKPLVNLQEANYDGTSMMRGLEMQLNRKLLLEEPRESVKNFVSREGTNERMEEESRRELSFPRSTDPSLNESFLHKFSKVNWLPSEEKLQVGTGERFPKGEEREYPGDRPVITREPVEMKKPEFIVGKLHPEARLIFEDSEIEKLSGQNVKQENFKQRPVLPVSQGTEESESINIKITNSNPQNKWNILKHKNTINKLKETLFIEEGYNHQAAEDKKLLDNVIRSVDKLYESSLERELKTDENEPPKVMSEDWRSCVPQETPVIVDVDSDPNVKLTKVNEEICAEGEPTKNQQEIQYQEEGQYSQKQAVCISNEEGEGYDDNEETYPESYFEQPPKPDYSRDIVSNVILEEDESEVYANDGAPEDAQKIDNLQIRLETGEVLNNNTEFNINRSEENEASENQHQDLGPDNATYVGVDPYVNSTDYDNIPQQQYIYESQEYNQNNDYNMGQYQGGNLEQGEYYGQPQDLANYTGEGMEQPYEHENVYDQQQGYEGSPALEQYGQNYQEQYNEGEIISNENYYNHGEYDGGYYEDQLRQNNEYPQNEEPKHPEMLQGEGLETNQGENAQHGDENKNSNARQGYLAQLLESDTESFQMEHGSVVTNEDSDFDFSLSQKQ